jgi:carbon starvation protein
MRGAGRPLTEDEPVPSKRFAPSGLVATAAERELQKRWDAPAKKVMSNSPARS